MEDVKILKEFFLNFNFILTHEILVLLKNDLNYLKDSIFKSVHLLNVKCHKSSFKQGRSFVNSPDWIKNIKEIINVFNKKVVK